MTNALFWQTTKPYILNDSAFCSKLSELPQVLVPVLVNYCVCVCVCAEGLERIFSDQ